MFHPNFALITKSLIGVDVDALKIKNIIVVVTDDTYQALVVIHCGIGEKGIELSWLAGQDAWTVDQYWSWDRMTVQNIKMYYIKLISNTESFMLEVTDESP